MGSGVRGGGGGMGGESVVRGRGALAIADGGPGGGGGDGGEFVAVEGYDLFEHGEEFGEAELLEDGGECGEEVGVDGGGGPVEGWDGDIELEFDEFAGVVEEVEVVAEGVADFASDFVGILEESVEGAEGLDPFGGCFWADPGDAGDVVDGIAGECENVAGLGGRVAFFGKESSGVDFFIGLNVIHDALIIDELVEVLVLGAHVNFAVGTIATLAIGADLADEGGHGIVGFVAFGFVDRDAEGFDDLKDAVDLLGHVFGHGFTLGFVGGVEDLAAGGAGVHC